MNNINTEQIAESYTPIETVKSVKHKVNMLAKVLTKYNIDETIQKVILKDFSLSFKLPVIKKN